MKEGPANSSSGAYYTGESGRIYHEQKRGVPGIAVPWIARLRAEKIQPWVKEGDVVFEYGVGGGWNLFALKCARKMGFDISEHAADQVRGTTIEFFTSTQSVPAETADILLCHHTLEHLLDPAHVLAEMRRLLKRGGKLLVFVPFEKERRYRHFDAAEPNHHFFSWNAQTLGNLVIECGFQIQQAGVGQFGYDRFAANLASKSRLGEVGFRSLRTFLHLIRPLHEVRVVARS